ncbi:hypothetical protein JOM56_001720 [Amanita muscaria]
MLAIFTYKHLQTLTNISYKVLNTHADIIQPGKNGPGLHQDVTNTPDSPGTRNDQEQDCTRMLQGILVYLPAIEGYVPEKMICKENPPSAADNITRRVCCVGAEPRIPGD